MFASLGGRKFFFAVALVLCLGGFVLAGKMSVDQFMTGALLALSIFTAGNAAQKFAK